MPACGQPAVFAFLVGSLPLLSGPLKSAPPKDVARFPKLGGTFRFFVHSVDPKKGTPRLLISMITKAVGRLGFLA